MDDPAARELEAELARVQAMVSDALSQVDKARRSDDPEMRELYLSVARARLTHARRGTPASAPGGPLAPLASLPLLAPRARGRWGRWHLDPGALTLEMRGDGGRVLHQIDLEECTSSGWVLDLLCRFAQKERLSPEDLGFLLRALDETLEPQRTLCSSGGAPRSPLPPRSKGGP